MIRRGEGRDFDQICAVINDGARAYEGVIPSDRWTEPYMPAEKLRHEIDDGVEFWVHEVDGAVAGVMGIQGVKDVTLVRHAYVRTADQRRGIGALLLAHLRNLATAPVLIGTWADATWAIRFYEKHGFRAVSQEMKEVLLRKYWSIPERQVETSVVLSDATWWEQHGSEQTAGAFERR
jgi:N-acetylglutamate synthase-like GNAT family acetyltransferase